MLLSERSWTDSSATSSPPQALELRLYGGTDDERSISVPVGKYSVGSGPRCSLRLQDAGVGPLHCLIVRDADGLRVRRWGDDTLVNGRPFDEVRLAPGDVLSVGPVELEVVAPRSDVQDPCPQASEPIPSSQSFERYQSPTRPGPTEFESESVVEQPTLVAALRRNRDQYDELVARINDLEQKIESAFAETDEPSPSGLHDLPGEPVVHGGQEDAKGDFRADQLTAELFEAQQELAKRDGELATSRAAIDTLERQLIDSQNTMQAFVDERTLWQEQLSELESRLAEYVLRIQELERHLGQFRAAKSDHSTATKPFVPIQAVVEPSSPELSNSAPVSDRETRVAPSAAAPSPGDAIPGEPSEPEKSDWSSQSTDGEFAANDPPQKEYDWSASIERHSSVENDADHGTVDGAGRAPAESTPTDTWTWSNDTDKSAVDRVDDQQEFEAEASEVWPVVEPDQPLPSEPGVDRSETVSHSPFAEATQPALMDEPNDELAQTGGYHPESFIDRYAHLFEKDDDVHSAGTMQRSTDDNAVAPAGNLRESTASSVGAGDDESIEQYMVKLLDRVRGGPASGGNETTGTVWRNDSVKSTPAASDYDSRPTEAADMESSGDEPTIGFSEMRPKLQAAELTGNMVAMRALANQSARHAIGIHAASKLRRDAFSRFLIAMLALAMGLYFFVQAPGVESLEFTTACIAMLAALYWGQLTFQSMFRAVRLGALEDYEESDTDFTAVDSLNPPLPIDVER